MKTIWKTLKKQYRRFEKERIQVIVRSGEIKREAKRLIHKIVSGNGTVSEVAVQELRAQVKALVGMVARHPELNHVGALNEGCEEYAELVFLMDYYTKKDFLRLIPKGLGHDALIGGMADATGELARMARAKMDITEAERVKTYTAEVYQQMVELDVSRNNKLRHKAGEVKRNLLQLEAMIFDLKLKHTGN